MHPSGALGDQLEASPGPAQFRIRVLEFVVHGRSVSKLAHIGHSVWRSRQRKRPTLSGRAFALSRHARRFLNIPEKSGGTWCEVAP
eukprot:5904379-Alexandrium_andersonii.AAC.1